MKINMGCGWRNFGSDWIHIDGGDYDHLDSSSMTDLSQYEDNTISLIYASHVIEYFDRQDVEDLLVEWRRVLKPGGMLRLAVPNFKAMAKLYCEGKVPLSSILGPLYGRMNMGKQKIYHKTTYDQTSLKELLTKLNYNDIVLYDWKQTTHSQFDDHSQAYIPHMNKESGILISLNIECKK